MANPTKILEIKGQDFIKGLSIQPDFAMGGLFQRATNFDPFETMGYFQPSLAPVQVDGDTITTRVNHLISSDRYVYALGDRGGTGEKCFYKIQMSDQTVTDLSSNIDANIPTGATTHNGITIYKGYIIYSQKAGISLRSVLPNGSSDVAILNSANNGADYNSIAFCVGVDEGLYYTAISSGAIGKIVLATGTSGNINNAFQFTDTNLIPRDITKDETYNIIIADNNGTKSTLTTSICKVFFWDGIKSKADVIFEIPDSYLISARYVNGRVVILGASGIWVCNSATAPKLVYPLTTQRLPTDQSQVSVQGNILYWAATPSGFGSDIYAYGSKIGVAILFQPFITDASDNIHTALTCCGTQFVASVDAGTNVPKVYIHNSGTTRANASFRNATTTLPQPFNFSSLKVVLKSKLIAGQEINITVYDGEGNLVMANTSKTYTAIGAKKTITFDPKTANPYVREFEELYVDVNTVGNVVVERVSVYGIPIDDYSQKV